uniref:Cilia- and flagella-associated protein 61 N-terminal domain-containing protein n=1 Tax=Bombyx mori TaxID=7091 RepID=A0A8R2M431_BOMMO|nr:cilia- and flagella-associated protein 61 isoform X2 [Bombyx mori]
MSIFFDFDVGGRGRRFRRAVDHDRHDIDLFWNRNETEDLFGIREIGSLIELSTLSICMINEKKEVVGFMSLCDHPNIPGVDPSGWEVWIRNMFQKYYLSRQTLFIHFFCCKDQVKDYFVEEALASVFLNDPYLSQVVLVVSPNVSDDYFSSYQTFKKRNFYKHYSKREEDIDKQGYCLYVASRQEFCVKFKLRSAVEEDNDDIVEILDSKCPRLKELYGEYYISEIVGGRPESKRKIIVADYQDQVVGVMCLNSEINYKSLQDMYELRPYHGLMRATPLEKEEQNRNNVLLETFGEPIMLGRLSPFDDISSLEELKSDQAFQTKSPENTVINNAKYRRTSKVDFISEISMRQNVLFDNDNEYYEDQTSHIAVDLRESSHEIERCDINYLLDEDPFDYDIVNIDQTLLNIPEVLSYELLPRSTEIRTKSRLMSMCTQKYRRRNSMLNVNKVKISENIEYEGTPNAMMIELFGLREDLDNRHAFDLLKAAFEIMIEYDYCIIRVPTAEKSFPLLQHFIFVPSKYSASCTSALYIAHRNSVMGPPENIDYFRGKFNISSYHTHKYHCKEKGLQCGFTTLKMVLSYSVFEPHFRFFARDIMRLSGASALIWLTGYRNKWVMKKANSLASVMIPLMPLESAVDYVIPDFKSDLTNKTFSFSAWFLPKKLTSVPMLYVTTRIVVVGASKTAMSFLNSLLFSDSSSYLLFTNVTLVSPNGLPYTKQSKPIAEMMFPTQNNTTDKHLKSIPYTYYVNVVHGTLVDIEKNTKYIVLSNGDRIHYDYLFLMFGKQFQHPNYLEPLLEKERNIALGKTPTYIRMDKLSHNALENQIDPNVTPENVFIINNTVEAKRALKYVQDSTWNYKTDFSSKIIVYGAKIQTYCCLTALLESKVPAENIVFVEPFPPENNTKTRVPIFCNVYVDRTVQEVLENLGIDVYSGYYFDNWEIDYDELVTRVDFISQYKRVRLDCAAFFYYGKRGINTQAYIAINKSGIVYDNGILIDNKFRTKDPNIYAAGPATAYCRKYYAESYKQKYYDSYEIGEKLGFQIQDELDPLFTKSSSTPKSDILLKRDSVIETAARQSVSSHKSLTYEEISEMQLPVFKKPLVTYCLLPGGLQYLEVRAPGKKIPHHYVQTMQFNGFVMETFKSGYFKLHLNNNMIVDGITCLSSKPYSIEKFKNIFGLSAVVLNNVHVRFTTKKIDNFYEYFSSPWAYFLYHQQTDELFAMVKELLPKGQSSGETVMEALYGMGQRIYDDQERKAINEIRTEFTKSHHIEVITDYVIEWLSENEVLLPMYIQTSEVVDYRHDIGRNPAFKKKKRSMKKLLSAVF